MAISLRGYQNRFLRGLAHSLKPVVLIGQKGLNTRIIKSIMEALDTHELIKVKFIELEDRAQKKTMIREIEDACGCFVAGVTGHVAILYRPKDDPAKRKIILPEGSPSESV
ncbi:MAG: ribosome assembly RNA-binding protein YhbY [Syntrophales bacterium]|nr:ribosome assembly RNA-binding protein YhbY [Syntrophales bacterium]